MIGLSLIIVTTVTVLVALAVVCSVVTRNPALQPATVDPFARPTVADPSAETIASGSADPTLAGDWQKVELNRLCDVEALLDRLEASGVRTREMEIVANDQFVVRWR